MHVMCLSMLTFDFKFYKHAIMFFFFFNLVYNFCLFTFLEGGAGERAVGLEVESLDYIFCFYLCCK